MPSKKPEKPKFQIGDLVEVYRPGCNYPGREKTKDSHLFSKKEAKYFQGIYLMSNEHIWKNREFRIAGIKWLGNKKTHVCLIRNEEMKIDLVIDQIGLKYSESFLSEEEMLL